MAIPATEAATAMRTVNVVLLADFEALDCGSVLFVAAVVSDAPTNSVRVFVDCELDGCDSGAPVTLIASEVGRVAVVDCVVDAVVEDATLEVDSDEELLETLEELDDEAL